jgi:hypothetical protein
MYRQDLPILCLPSWPSSAGCSVPSATNRLLLGPRDHELCKCLAVGAYSLILDRSEVSLYVSCWSLLIGFKGVAYYIGDVVRA